MASSPPTDPATTKLHQLELSIGNARLIADYTSRLPTLLRKWRKRLAGPQSAILESVCQAESLLYSLGKRAWKWPPLLTVLHDTHTNDQHPNLSPDHGLPDDQTLTLAQASVHSALNALLHNHNLHPPLDTSSPFPIEFSHSVRSLLGTSQLFLELITIKAHVYYARAEHTQCLAILTNELTLPPNDPGLSLNPMGIVYLIKALTLLIACLFWDISNDPSSLAVHQARLYSCLKYALHIIPFSGDPASHSPTTNEPVLPFTKPIPMTALTSVHVQDPLAFYLFVGSVNWIQAWLKMLSIQTSLPHTDVVSDHASRLSPLPELSSRSMTPNQLPPTTELALNQEFVSAESNLVAKTPSPSSSVDSFPTMPKINSHDSNHHSFSSSVLLPALSYQTLDFVRGFFVLCCNHNAVFTLFLVQWVIRFIVMWFVVIVRYESHKDSFPFPDTIYAEYVPIDPSVNSAWKADTLAAELDSLFHAWFAAILKIHSFPPANTTDWPPSRINKYMEELVATLQWSDDLLGLKSFSIQMLESSIRHTFHSFLCHRILAATHFRLGNIQPGLALLRRYIELREGSEEYNSKTYDFWIYPEMNARLVALYNQVGCAGDGMFVVKDDGINEFASLLVEGSQRLAETDQLTEALNVARQAYALVDSSNSLNPETSHSILVNLGSLLGFYALAASFESAERSRLQGEAIELLKKAISMKQQSASAHFHLGLIYADRGELSVSKTHGKQVLKLNKSHIAGWHLLVLILTATRDFEGALKMAELGIRESVASLVPFTHQIYSTSMSDQMQADITRRSILDALTALARDQSLNCIWAPPEYDKIVASIFRLRLVQSRIVEQLRGSESSVALVQELFRWYKVVFDQDVIHLVGNTSPSAMIRLSRGSGSGSSGISPQSLAAVDSSRTRTESVRSTASNWSISHSTGSAGLQVKQARKRTMLASVLTHTTIAERVVLEGGPVPMPAVSSGGNDRPRGQSITSVLSLSASESSSIGAESVVSSVNMTRNEILAEMWICLSHIHINSGQVKEAASYLAEASNLAIQDAWLDGEIAALDYALGNIEQALARWHRLLSVNPHHMGALIGLARAHIDAGQMSEAELLLEDLILYAGHMSVDAWYLYGRLCKAQHQPDRALKYFHRALELERNEPIQDLSRVPRLSLVTLL